MWSESKNAQMGKHSKHVESIFETAALDYNQFESQIQVGHICPETRKFLVLSGFVLSVL